MNKKQRVYTKGMEDVERVLENISSEASKAKREAWIREHYSKVSKKAKQKESE